VAKATEDRAGFKVEFEDGSSAIFLLADRTGDLLITSQYPLPSAIDTCPRLSNPNPGDRQNDRSRGTR
jgi:hypothetical protein